MSWQLKDVAFRQAIREAVERLDGRCALVGVVGAQIHLALAVGVEKLGPPARAIELFPFGGQLAPERVGDIPVRHVGAMGFEASIEARMTLVELDGERFPVAAPEHILGLSLAAPDLPADIKWACSTGARTTTPRSS
jgi:hypothetical protein